MYKENLFLDFKSDVKIPISENNFLLIEKTNIVSNSIEISFDPRKEINLLNLYITIKSYLNNLEFLPNSFLISIKNLEEKAFVVSNVYAYEFKNVKYFGFIRWYKNQVEEDWKYFRNLEKYSYIVTYPTDVFDKKKLKYLKPIFPWSHAIIEEMNKVYMREEELLEVIKQKDEEITRLKKELEKIIKSRL